jgi:TolB-like protein
MSTQSSFLKELQRRNVYKVGAAYAVGGWLLVQVVTQVFPIFEISALVQRIIVLAIVAGFPMALVLAWVFDITPQGIVRTEELAAGIESPARQHKPHGMDRKLNLILGALLLLGLAYVVAERTGHVGGRSAGFQPAAAHDKSIAVLPFDNLSRDPDNAYFAEGIQDEILTRLAGIGDLKVISRSSTRQYASRPDNLKTVAAELGVATLLEGSVQKSGERVRVNVQLIDARSDTHLWANTYDRELKDAFAVESEVSQDIADALKARLSPNEISALALAPTANADAYDAFLKAEYSAGQAADSGAGADYRRAEGEYRQALALDPDFALAHARLALCLISRHWLVKALPADELAGAKQHIDRALALAPQLAEAQLALGHFYFWGQRDYEAAKAAFEQALKREPNNAQAIAALAFVHRRQGDWQAAIDGLASAISHAPRDADLLTEYGASLMVVRRYRDAGQALGRSRALDPAFMDARSFTVRNFLLGSGDAARALQTFDELPPQRMAPVNNDDGDVLNVVNARVYPYLYQRRYDEALRAWDAVTPGSEAQRIEKQSARVAILTLSGRQKIAHQECEALRGLLAAQLADAPDDLLSLTRISWAYACLGRSADAMRSARRAAELMPADKDPYSGHYFQNGLAQIAAYTGDRETALQIVGQLLATPAGDTLSQTRLNLDPVWDPLRGDARFQKLLAAAALVR